MVGAEMCLYHLVQIVLCRATHDGAASSPEPLGHPTAFSSEYRHFHTERRNAAQAAAVSRYRARAAAHGWARVPTSTAKSASSSSLITCSSSSPEVAKSAWYD